MWIRRNSAGIKRKKRKRLRHSISSDIQSPKGATRKGKKELDTTIQPQAWFQPHPRKVIYSKLLLYVALKVLRDETRPTQKPVCHFDHYSRFVTTSRFLHKPLTTMFGVYMDTLWPPNQCLEATFWIPASEGHKSTQRPFGGKFQFLNFFHKPQQYGCLWTPLELRNQN